MEYSVTMKYALVTGASKGIGRELAKGLASRGYGLLLVARSAELLESLASELRDAHQVDVQVRVQDLAEPGAALAIQNWLHQGAWPLNVLVNNAGYGLWGSSDRLDIRHQLQLLQVNMITLFELSLRCAPMLEKTAPSYLLNVGSMAGLQAMPTLNAYAASKAFVNSFTRGLRHELKPRGITVTLLAPGSVDTHFIEVSGMQHMQEKARRMSLSAKEVAGKSLDALFNRKSEVIPGFGNQIMALAIKVLPKSWVENLAASLYRN